MAHPNHDRSEGTTSRGTAVRSISSTIIDVPTIREHKLSNLSIQKQSYVLVRLITQDGVEGYGEAATLGGPLWAEESVETIKMVIDTYLGPFLIGHSVTKPRAGRKILDRAAKRNNAAKAALETALLDAFGRTIGQPMHALLGGLVRDKVPVLWALASGDPSQEIDEALSLIDARRHFDFKIKIGAKSPDEDIERLSRVATGLAGKGVLKVVDANQAWDEVTANRCIPALSEIGIELLEQPLPDWNLQGAARVAARHQLPLLADESVFTKQDAWSVASAGAAQAVSLKLVKHGGPLAMMDVAAASEAGGLGLYGGCLLEGPIGTAAQLHVYGALPSLVWGSESFGPLIMKDELATTPIDYKDGFATVPTGPGLGVELDDDMVAFYSRSGGFHDAS